LRWSASQASAAEERIKQLAKKFSELPEEKRKALVKRYLEYFVSRARENPPAAAIEFMTWLVDEGMVVWYYMWKEEYRPTMFRVARAASIIFFRMLAGG